eukprot:1696083-Amphidinium_carterae.1
MYTKESFLDGDKFLETEDQPPTFPNPKAIGEERLREEAETSEEQDSAVLAQWGGDLTTKLYNAKASQATIALSKKVRLSTSSPLPYMPNESNQCANIAWEQYKLATSRTWQAESHQTS